MPIYFWYNKASGIKYMDGDNGKMSNTWVVVRWQELRKTGFQNLMLITSSSADNFPVPLTSLFLSVAPMYFVYGSSLGCLVKPKFPGHPVFYLC